MGDSDRHEKKPGVPSWQLDAKPTKPKEAKEPASDVPSRETIVEQAKKFLEEEEVRNAPTDKKIAFLEGKGLKNEEINALLGVARNPEASAPPQTAQPPPNLPTQSSYLPPPTRDTPPIITYPEFLTIPPHPTPLVTKSRLLTTLYLFGGVSTLLYGTDAYLIKPMLESLTMSRLSLAETTSSNLQKLINRLAGAVSEIPQSRSGKTGFDEAEDEESDEDPTELFHRDIGVQTSLPATPSLSRPASPAPQATPLDDQTARLTSLTTSISELLQNSTSEGREVNDLSTTIGVLREYLDGLAYVVPSYGYGVSYGLGGSNVKDQDDEIGKVKASIRGVKGVLLSARSFPGVGVRAR